ncbi:hypothetical protein A0126_17875 (plasmid) [Exiguobacterium sp. N4-1P]|uniref:nucleotidyltransferase family protein n=1 Tax=Exiguobacterium sp. N4-1P TaxID=2051906 RepID=UPI000B592E1B|nr:nucleotidyltransferase family protein [Exiguobacterium sp. N4-1P]ASI35427.1 hypothetical protein A0126_07595 [Exiguobacterium sp. N4-1P]ASI37440.1 hypothetical protein A0126_17875 [Exiguobacterium sp. N4-1P]
MKTETDIVQMFERDRETRILLEAVATLDLPDWWICAGYVRAKIWDFLEQKEATAVADIDVIYFDASDTTEATDQMLEARLNEQLPDYPWSVKNQARMHTKNDLPPYRSSRDAMAQFPETVTAIGLTLQADQLEFFTAYGVGDLLQQRLQPTPLFQATARQVIYRQRLTEKQWGKNWPGVHEAENEAT